MNALICVMAFGVWGCSSSGGGGASTTDLGPQPNDASGTNDGDLSDAGAGDASAGDAQAGDATNTPGDASPDSGADAQGPDEPDQGFRCLRDFECDDSNACTDDVCVDGVCQSAPNDATCDDGTFCNGVEQCVEGECITGPIPCPAAEDCDEETARCTACETDEHCPAPEVVRRTPCRFEHICHEQGQNEEDVATYSCVEGACAATTEQRDGTCERSSDGLPCGGGAQCQDGACPRDPLIRVVSSGWVNFNARFFAACVETNETCLVEGNRNRMDRGSMDMFCELLCPAGSTVQFCCSNGSAPCSPNDRLAPRAGVTIDSVTSVGFADSNCDLNPAVGAPAQCQALMGEGDARAECIFRREP